MKKLKYFVLIVSVILGSAGCSDFAETNIDPTRQADVSLNLMLPEALTQAAYNQSSTSARMTGIIMQQFTGFDAQQVQYTDYIISEDAFNNYWNVGLYSGVLRTCQIIIEKAQEEGNSYYEGIAKIIMAESFGMATMMFGDMPFSEALKGIENLKPVYDSQESVLAGVQRLLDEGISALQNPSGISPAGADLFYGGDADAWIKVAHALKARYLIQSLKKDSGNAQKALSEISAAFKSIDEQPWFQYEDTQIGNNPLAKFGIGRPNTLVINEGFAQKMLDRGDPRRDYYLEDAGSQFSFYNPANPKLVWAQNDSPVPLISYVEVKFLEAEALARTNAGAGAVSTALKEAITASMEQMGVTEDYSAFVDARSDLSGLSDTEVIERIIEEAYYAYYGHAFQQVWHNYRRTNIPNLTANPNGANGLNPSGVIPRRFLYPVNEVATNGENLQAAKDRQNGALLDATLWVHQ